MYTLVYGKMRSTSIDICALYLQIYTYVRVHCSKVRKYYVKHDNDMYYYDKNIIITVHIVLPGRRTVS